MAQSTDEAETYIYRVEFAAPPFGLTRALDRMHSFCSFNIGDYQTGSEVRSRVFYLQWHFRSLNGAVLFLERFGGTFINFSLPTSKTPPMGEVAAAYTDIPSKIFVVKHSLSTLEAVPASAAAYLLRS